VGSFIGGAVSNAFGNWTLRAELAYETDRFFATNGLFPDVQPSDQWSSVIGIDWQGWRDQFISLQWFQKSIIDHRSEMSDARRNDIASFLWESVFMNETVKWQWLQIHSLDDSDGVVQLKLSYNYETNIDVYVGADHFYGRADGFYGQFDQADRLTVGIEWGF
jgi:hypothetical protein